MKISQYYSWGLPWTDTWQQYCYISTERPSVKNSLSPISGIRTPLFLVSQYCYRLLPPTPPLLSTSMDRPSGEKFVSAQKGTMTQASIGKGVLTTNNQTRKLQNA